MFKFKFQQRRTVISSHNDVQQKNVSFSIQTIHPIYLPRKDLRFVVRVRAYCHFSISGHIIWRYGNVTFENYHQNPDLLFPVIFTASRLTTLISSFFSSGLWITSVSTVYSFLKAHPSSFDSNEKVALYVPVSLYVNDITYWFMVLHKKYSQWVNAKYLLNSSRPVTYLNQMQYFTTHKVPNISQIGHWRLWKRIDVIRIIDLHVKFVYIRSIRMKAAEIECCCFRRIFKLGRYNIFRRVGAYDERRRPSHNWPVGLFVKK